MCGIVGAIAERNVVPLLLECLKRLEYRGYDSAGIAVLPNDSDKLQRLRQVGKIDILAKALQNHVLAGNTGIAHTRWATHGAPTENNAHPHFSREEIGIVHNGIIENHQEIREELIASGYKFASETDTEAVVHNVHKLYNEGADFLTAVHQTITRLEGMYSLVMVHSKESNRLIAVNNGNAVVIGIGEGKERFIASDRLALTRVAKQFIYLEEGDLVDIQGPEISIYDSSLHKVERPIHTVSADYDAADRGIYKHYMQKEIFEQPKAIADTLFDRLDPLQIADDIFGEEAREIFSKVQRVHIAACGTSYHAGLVARYWLEEFANLPCQVDIASELRYQHIIAEPNTLLVVISQSGETADILALLRQSKKTNYLSRLAICNVVESSLARESDLKFFTRAGAEIGVASTKAFTAQLASLLLLALALGKHNGLSQKLSSRLIQELKHLPSAVETCLALDGKMAELAGQFADKEHAIYLGRGTCYPIALEGALKMKEISYIHAEAYAAGELKHGPLALVDKHMPVVVLAPNNDLLAKVKNNIKEIEARGGQLFIFTDSAVDLQDKQNFTVIKIPSLTKEIAPIVYTVPLQLLAYHVALLKGTDIDQPRNLAKSVTVE